MTYEHLQYLTAELLESPVQLYALDLSCNYIFAATWPEIRPSVKQLLTKAVYVDLAGNYLPALLPEQLELQDMLKQHVSFTAPNRYLGSEGLDTTMDIQSTRIPPEGIQVSAGPPAGHDYLGIPFTAAGCRDEAEDSDTD